MPPGGGVTYRPLAETSVPPLEELKSRGRRTDTELDGFAWNEDAVTRWRALALFGGLVLSEDLFFSSAGGRGGELLFGGVLLFFGAILVAAAGGEEYSWAVVGAAVLAAGLGFPTFRGGEVVPWPAATFYGGIVPTNASAWIETVLLVGGFASIILGMARSIQISRLLDREEPSPSQVRPSDRARARRQELSVSELEEPSPRDLSAERVE